MWLILRCIDCKGLFSYIIQATRVKCVEDTTVSHHEDVIWRRWQRIPKGRGVGTRGGSVGVLHATM